MHSAIGRQEGAAWKGAGGGALESPWGTCKREDKYSGYVDRVEAYLIVRVLERERALWCAEGGKRSSSSSGVI